MSSNVKSRTVQDYKSHHLEFWYKRSHPVVLCVSQSIFLYETSIAKARSSFNGIVLIVSHFNLSSSQAFFFKQTRLKKRMLFNKTIEYTQF